MSFREEQDWKMVSEGVKKNMLFNLHRLSFKYPELKDEPSFKDLLKFFGQAE